MDARVPLRSLPVVGAGMLALVCLFALGLGGCATLTGDQESRLQSLEQEAAAIQARIENLETDTTQAMQDLAEVQAELLVLRSGEQARSHVESADGGGAESRSRESASPSPAPVRESSGDASSGSDPGPSAPPPQRSGAPPGAAASGGGSPAAMQALYDQALAVTRAGQTGEGRSLFTQFLETYPRSELAPNAVYWLGETYYHEQDYGQAILTFKEVRRLYPEHSKAAAAMLKIGYSYERLGDTTNARFYLRQLLEEYPDSEPAGLAREKLAALQ